MRIPCFAPYAEPIGAFLAGSKFRIRDTERVRAPALPIPVEAVSGDAGIHRDVRQSCATCRRCAGRPERLPFVASAAPSSCPVRRHRRPERYGSADRRLSERPRAPSIGSEAEPASRAEACS